MSSKRKSNSQSMQVMSADIQFEDDDEVNSAAGDSAKGSRVSNRAKKAKAIYDPSEHNGPVHKRKKEAMEKEIEKLKSPIKTIKHTTGSSPKQTIEATKPASVTTSSESSKSKVPVEKKAKTLALEIKKPPMVTLVMPASKKEVTPVPAPVPVAKEPSKRIQARKQTTVQNNIDMPSRVKKQRLESLSTNCSTEDYDKASTVDILVETKQIPDVRKWSFQQVFEYFNKALGFKAQDAVVFKDEEIDGEALLIMKRSDIVNTKFQQLKLGVALKMWTHIIQFQTGSSDPTQAWK